MYCMRLVFAWVTSHTQFMSGDYIVSFVFFVNHLIDTIVYLLIHYHTVACLSQGKDVGLPKGLHFAK